MAAREEPSSRTLVAACGKEQPQALWTRDSTTITSSLTAQCSTILVLRTSTVLPVRRAVSRFLHTIRTSMQSVTYLTETFRKYASGQRAPTSSAGLSFTLLLPMARTTRNILFSISSTVGVRTSTPGPFRATPTSLWTTLSLTERSSRSSLL